MKTALVAGATGLIGKQCMYKLLENANYEKVIVLVRRKFEIKHPKLEQLIVDYDNLENLTITDKIDDVFCCLGTTMKKAGSKEAFKKVDYDYVLKLAEFGLSKGAKKFLLISANGADPNAAIYYSKVKGEVENAVKSLSYETIFIFRPSILVGNREEFRLGERLGISLALLLSPIMLGVLRKYRPIHGAVVANAMIKKAQSAEKGNIVLESDKIQELGATN